MLAGIAAADITPQVGTPLQGHFSLHPESRGILAPLEIRTGVFQSGSTGLVIITADLIGVPLDFTRRVRTAVGRQYSIPPANILIAASHTHCGPAMLPCIGLKPIPEIVADIEAKMVASVGEALANVEPVRLGVGASAAHFNINRRPRPGTTEIFPNAAGVVDQRVRILRVDKMDGMPLTILFHYSCHPTAKNGSDGMISPDYPGMARAIIERELGCRAAFLPGCSGNIRPNLVENGGQFISANEEQLAGMGHELAVAVVTAAKYTRTFDEGRLASAEAECVFPFGEKLKVEKLEQMAKRAEQPLRADWARRQLSGERESIAAKGEASMMHAMRMGPVRLVGIPGEPVQEIGYAIEREAAGKFDDVWPVGYANDQIGYFCTPRMYEEGGYEPTAYVVYDRPAAYEGEQGIILHHAAFLLGCL